MSKVSITAVDTWVFHLTLDEGGIMKRGLAVILLFLLPIVVGSGPVDPDSVIPTITEDTYQELGGIFGPSSKFNKEEIKLLNLMNYISERVFDEKFPVDIYICNAADMTIQEAVRCLTDFARYHENGQKFTTDLVVWGKAAMTCEEFTQAITDRVVSIESRIYALENP
jgi:hypothetical protein